MPTTKLRLGKGARGSVLSKYVHPKPILSRIFPNGVPGGKFEDVVVEHIGERKVSGKMRDVVWFHHESVKDGDEYIKLCAVTRFLKLTSEGDPDLFFEAEEAGAQEPPEDEQQPAELIEILGRAEVGIFNSHDDYEARHLVRQIDDDNEPAPENVPGGGMMSIECLMLSLGTMAFATGRKPVPKMFPSDSILLEEKPRPSTLCHPSFLFLIVSS
jgi:hypothetical protein